MAVLLSKINTNTGLIFSLKSQVVADNSFVLQEITDLSNNKYNKNGGLIRGDVPRETEKRTLLVRNLESRP